MRTTVDHPALPKTVTLGPHRRLTDGVHAALRDAITTGALAPGDRLREVEIARHFHISPTPVREAIRRLERDGLVDVSPHRGATVARLDSHQLAELYDIHELLEGHAVRMAAERAPHDLRSLDDILQATEPLMDDSEQNELAFNQIDLRFHRHLNELSGNAALAELIEQIHLRIQAIRIHVAGQIAGRPARSHAEHVALLAAVNVGDADRAELLARRHIHHVRETVLHILADQEKGVPTEAVASAAERGA